MNVTVYSTSTCATCHLVTDWLEKQNISYTKRVTDEDDAAMIDFMAVNEGMVGVPFTVIDGPDGNVSKITGFDHAKFKQALGL